MSPQSYEPDGGAATLHSGLAPTVTGVGRAVNTIPRASGPSPLPVCAQRPGCSGHSCHPVPSLMSPPRLPTCGLLCCPPPSQPLRLLTPHLRWPQSTVPPCSSFSHEHSLSLAHHDIRLLIPSLSRGLTFVTVAGEGWKVTSCSFPLLSAGQQLHVVSLARHSWGRPARGSDVGVSVAATSASSLP